MVYLDETFKKAMGLRANRTLVLVRLEFDRQQNHEKSIPVCQTKQKKIFKRKKKKPKSRTCIV